MRRSRSVSAVVMVVLVSLAAGCGQGAQSAPPSAPASVQASATPEPSLAPTGLVTTVEELPNATIQIVATGSFVSPEWGEYEGGGAGSGFIIDPSGIAVTNSHVVSGAGTVEVHVGGEPETVNAQILGVSECNDLAVIDLAGDGYSYLDWYDGPITPGLDVVAAGYPLGDPQFTVTAGIISKSDFTQADQWASVDAILEHDARIRPGNSGGPLVTDEMAVIGVNYAGRDDTDQNYAISVTDAVGIVEQLAAGVDVDSVGINGYAVTADDGTTGIWVETVQPGSGADAAGVTGGDIVTRMAGVSLGVEGTMAEFCDVIRTQGSSGVIPVEVLRYATSQVLRGQVNGTPLAEAFSFADELEDEGTVDEGGEAAYAEYVVITDDTGAIQVEIPTEWTDIDGAPYTDSDGNAVTDVRASSDLGAFADAWDTPGFVFSASSDWAGQATTESMLDELSIPACEYAGREPYEDPAYSGFYDLFINCGNELATFVVVAAEPPDGSFLILVSVQANEERDFDALDRILASFFVIGEV